MDERKQALRKRATALASAEARFYISLDKSREEIRVLGRQALRSGTSVAANYREASRARSEAEFISKADQCAQEADETLLWLELLRDDCEVQTKSLEWLLKEADELIAIFVTMSKNVKARMQAKE